MLWGSFHIDDDLREFSNNGSKFFKRFAGFGDSLGDDKSCLPEKLREKCLEIEEMNKGAKFVCNIALNYGGRAEIVNAAKTLNEKGLPITEENLSRAMYTADTPDPDLIIRTGGDFRVSNFLIWQGAYSEFMILDTLWPDFGRSDIEKCVKEFYTRKRRFGGLDKEDVKE